MASILRHTAVWTGAPGLPGYSQFYQFIDNEVSDDAQVGHYAVGALFSNLASLIPDSITVTTDPVYQVLDGTTGEALMEGTVGDPNVPTEGGYVSNWSAQVGALIEWVTGFYIDGHKLRGRTYLVPLGNVSDNDGTLPAGTLAVLQSAAAYITGASPKFVVWHRPVSGAGGLPKDITSFIVRDKACILRSRML